MFLGLAAAVMGVGCGSGSSANKDAAPADGGGQDRSTGQEGGPDAATDMMEGTPGTTPVRLKTSVSSLMVVEGATVAQTFLLSLDRPWSEPITVTASAANPNVAIVIPETIEFLPQDIGPKEVKVVAALDDDTADDKTTITLSSVKTGSAIVTVDVDDVDVQAILATPGRVSMTEGRIENLTVRLNNRPGSTIVVTATSSDGTKLAVSPASLSFNAMNYNKPQTVTLTAAQDDDAILENLTLNLTATGNIAPLPVPVEITDDDAVNLDVTPANLTLQERGGMPGTLSVKLTRVPTSDVTVTVASSTTTKATFTPATLTFTAANATTAQDVHVTAVPDDDSRDETVTMTFSASGIPTRSATVTIDDPDTQALQIMPAALTVGEGTTGTFAVRLALNPGSGSNVTVNAFSQNPSKIEVSPPVLTFSSTNFSTPQMITVRALQDDDLANDMTNVTLLASGGDTGNVTVNITDDDAQAIQLIPAVQGTTLTMQETQVAGVPSTSPLGVRLQYKPAAPVTVAVASSSASKLTVNPASVTFTPTNYATVQFVTLTAPHDNDMVDEDLAVTASSAGLPDAKVTVKILDTDVQQFDISPTSLAPIAEGGPGTGFLVRLIVMPSSKVTASITTGGSTKVTVTPSQCVFDATNFMSGCTVGVTGNLDTDTRDEAVTLTVADQAGDPDVQAIRPMPTMFDGLMEGTSMTLGVRLAFNPVETVTVNVFSGDSSRIAVSPPVLTFNAGDFDTVKPVTIQALPDDDVASDNGTVAGHPRVTVTLGSSVAPSIGVPIGITDDDTQSIIVTPTPPTSPLMMTEGTTSTLAVRLAYRPEANTTVTVASSSVDDLSLCIAQPCAAAATQMLTFSPLTYSQPQLVTLTARDDTDVENEIVNVSATAPGVAAASSATLAVNINDKDVLAFLVTPRNLMLGTLLEGVGTAPLIVKLTNDPGPGVSITATIASNDYSAIAVTSPPSAMGATCLLTGGAAGTWNAGCQLMVTAVPDDDALDENVNITVMGAGVAPVNVGVTTDDDDTQVLVATANGTSPFNPVIVSESDAMPAVTGSFKVNFAYDPVNPTQVSFAPSIGGHLVITGGSSCTLTSSNYNTTGCVVGVSGLADLDLIEQNVSIQVSAAPGAGASDIFVNVRKTEDDTQALLLSSPPCNREMMERDPGSRPPGDDLPASLLTVPETNDPTHMYSEFCVRLAYRPNVTNTVTLTPSYKDQHQPLGVADFNFAVNESSAPSMLTFTEGGSLAYFKSQSVRIAGSQDSNLDNDLATVGVSVVPLADPKFVAIAMDDDDAQGIVLSPAGPIALTEKKQSGMAGSMSISVSLPFMPLRNVASLDASSEVITVQASSNKVTLGGGLPATGGGRRFEFTNANYANVQTLQVTAVQDDDALDPTAITLTFTSDRPPAPDRPDERSTRTVVVNVDDQDVPALVFSGLTSGAIAIDEGTNGTVGLRLAVDPGATTTVTCTPAGAPVSVTDTDMQFTFTGGSTGNWSTSKDINISVAEDSNSSTEAVSVTCTASGATPMVPMSSFTVNATDDEM
jgi:hypothetical protein